MTACYQDEDDFDPPENEPEEELAEWMFLMRYDLDYPNEPPKFGHHEFNVLRVLIIRKLGRCGMTRLVINL